MRPRFGVPESGGFKRDAKRVDHVRGVAYVGRNLSETQHDIGRVGEKIVYDALARIAQRAGFTIELPHEYDDYVHHADVVISPLNDELVQGVATADILVDSDVLEDDRVHPLVVKLGRTKQYIENLRTLTKEYAEELKQWMDSGGLAQARNESNEALFKRAESLLLLKYHVPHDSPSQLGKPEYVIGGPQAVISIHRELVESARRGEKVASKKIADLSLVEFAYCVQGEYEYLMRLLGKEENPNSFIKDHMNKLKSWKEFFEQPPFYDELVRIQREHGTDKSTRAHLSYFQNIFKKVYGVTPL